VHGPAADNKGPAPNAPEKAPTGRAPEDDVRHLMEHWHDFGREFGRAAPLSKTCLLDAKPLSVDGSKVVIALDPEFAVNREKLLIPRVMRSLEMALGEVLRREIESVEIRVLESKSTVPGDIKVADLEAKSPAAHAPAEVQRARKSKHEWMQNPAVQRALEMFNGDISDIRE
jgi:hypothetical protein